MHLCTCLIRPLVLVGNQNYAERKPFENPTKHHLKKESEDTEPTPSVCSTFIWFLESILKIHAHGELLRARVLGYPQTDSCECKLSNEGKA